MPIFEYVCAECGKKFEKLVLSSRREREICCPECGSGSVNKAMSVFGTSGSSSGSGAASSAGCAPSG